MQIDNREEMYVEPTVHHQFQIGDSVTVTNGNGLKIMGHKVTALCHDNYKPTYKIDWDCPWVEVQQHRLASEDPNLIKAIGLDTCIEMLIKFSDYYGQVSRETYENSNYFVSRKYLEDSLMAHKKENNLQEWYLTDLAKYAHTHLGLCQTIFDLLPTDVTAYTLEIKQRQWDKYTFIDLICNREPTGAIIEMAGDTLEYNEYDRAWKVKFNSSATKNGLIKLRNALNALDKDIRPLRRFRRYMLNTCKEV